MHRHTPPSFKSHETRTQSMAGLRFTALFHKISPSPLRDLIHFSSSSKPNPNFSNFEGGGSSVYKHKLIFQRPPTITYAKWRWEQWRQQNLVSFIGSVSYPVKTVRSQKFGVYTFLQVRESRNLDMSFRILLKMWGRMAEIASKHLKENDLIHVSGKLGSYTKNNGNGHFCIKYEVTVFELNYVAHGDRSKVNKISERLEPNEPSVSTSGAPDMEEKMNRLRLWQVFFVSPNEWWDNRKNKRNPRAPDFKHKDTGEALWLSPDDPPWLRRQLQLQDSRMADRGYDDFGGSRSRVSMWKYDE